jgi:hypothetical protein
MARDAQRREKRGDHGVRSSMGVVQCRHSSIVIRQSSFRTASASPRAPCD